MEIRFDKYYSIPIKIDKEMLEEIEKLFVDRLGEAHYSVYTIDDSTIHFDSKNELLEFDNSLNRKIINLAISFSNREEYFSNNVITFNSFRKLGEHIITTDDMIHIVYRVGNEEIDSHIKSEFDTILRNNKLPYGWIITKRIYWNIFIAFILTTFCKLIPIDNMKFSNPSMGYLIVYLFMFSIILSVVTQIGNFIISKYFNSIVFYFGKNIKKFDNEARIRQTLTWFILGIVVSSIVAWIFELIKK